MQSHNSGFLNEQQKFSVKHVIIKADWAKYIGSDSHRNLKIQEIQRRFGLLKGIHATNIHTYIHTYIHTHTHTQTHTHTHT